MLSRVADSIYWMSRYVERAENIARSIDVNYNLALDLGPEIGQPLEPADLDHRRPRGVLRPLRRGHASGT